PITFSTSGSSTTARTLALTEYSAETLQVQSGKGTSRVSAEFSVRANVVAVVDDPEVEKVIGAILDTTSTGSAGDGKIFVSTVTEAIDIGTRKRGQTAIV
ncbi:MAG TPA: P-II family nitrogen regulator, partial [Nitrososphaera sp.]|nr:P-II family nitrogen regulator [Nitrososphaera sp.]